MALMEAFITDQLLVNCSRYVVHLAARRDSATGTGFPSDPFNAGGSPADVDPPLDRILRSLPEGTPIKLEPGVYYTNGFNTTYNPDSLTNPKGWRPKSRTVLAGSGVHCTFLKLTDAATSGQFTSAIGCDLESDAHFLQGFEARDFSIDASYATQDGADSSVGGIAISGRNLTVRNVHVLNFGAKGNGPRAYGISLARAFRRGGGSPLTLRPTNCLIESCRIAKKGGLGGTSTAGTVGLHFGGSSNAYGIPHDTCVMRDNLVDFDDTNQSLNFIGMIASGGRGTIIERNFFQLMKVGMGFESGKTWDMVFRRNQFQLVRHGVEMIAGEGDFLGQLVMLHNRFDLAAFGPVKGIYLKGATEQLAPGPFVLRRNLVRRSNPETGWDDDRGIELDTCTAAIVERNVIDVQQWQENSVHATACANLKTFSNRKQDGSLLRGYNASNSTYSYEWEVEVDNIPVL